MAGHSALELALLAVASLGILLATRTTLRMMRSRAAIASKLQHRRREADYLCE
jgi:hypothetical protein